MTKMRVLIVDDSPLSREVLRRTLELDPRLTVAGEAKTGEEAVSQVRLLKPHLITMDLNMPGMGGMAAAEQLRQEWPAVPISLLTANVQTATRERAAALGLGFVEKPITEARIATLLATLTAA